jgi:hypothetical protein
MKKKLLIVTILLNAVIISATCQPVKAIIKMKDGKTIEAYHFGKLKCESNAYASSFTTLRGKFHDSHTEISDYGDISKLILNGFTAAPVVSAGNEKGTITVLKKNGVSVVLEEAELVMSCYNPKDRYNEIHIQIINPLTNEKADVAIEMRKIESISF